MGVKKSYPVLALRSLLCWCLQAKGWDLDTGGLRALVDDINHEYISYQYLYKNFYHEGIRSAIRKGIPETKKEEEYIRLLLRYADFNSLSHFLSLHPLPSYELGLIYHQDMQAEAAGIAQRLGQKGFHCMWAEQDFKTTQWSEVDRLVRAMQQWAPGKHILLLLSWTAFVDQEPEGKINSGQLNSLSAQWEKDNIGVFLCFLDLDPGQLSPAPGRQQHLLDGWEEQTEVLEHLIRKLEQYSLSSNPLPPAHLTGSPKACPVRFAHVFYSDAKKGNDAWFDLLETGALLISTNEVIFEHESRKLEIHQILAVARDNLTHGGGQDWLRIHYIDHSGKPAFAWFAEAPEHGQGYLAARDPVHLLEAFRTNGFD